MAFEESKAGQRAGASSRVLMRHPSRNNPTERVDWAGASGNLANSSSDDSDCNPYEYAPDHHRRSTSSCSDASTSSSSSSAEWEGIEDEDEEMMEDVVIAAMGNEEEGEEDEGVPLRDFRGAKHTFRIDAEP